MNLIKLEQNYWDEYKVVQEEPETLASKESIDYCLSCTYPPNYCDKCNGFGEIGTTKREKINDKWLAKINKIVQKDSIVEISNHLENKSMSVLQISKFLEANGIYIRYAKDNADRYIHYSYIYALNEPFEVLSHPLYCVKKIYNNRYQKILKRIIRQPEVFSYPAVKGSDDQVLINILIRRSYIKKMTDGRYKWVFNELFNEDFLVSNLRFKRLI